MLGVFCQLMGNSIPLVSLSWLALAPKRRRFFVESAVLSGLLAAGDGRRVTVDTQRQAKAILDAGHSSRITPKRRPKQVDVSCDGIMYLTNQRETCPNDPGRHRMIWR